MDSSEGLEWAETARWIKFEEDVEEGSGRWGRPHISALTFHSLMELQRGLDTGEEEEERVWLTCRWHRWCTSEWRADSDCIVGHTYIMHRQFMTPQ